MSSLQSLVPLCIPCTVAALCSQTTGPGLLGVSVSLMEVTGRKYFLNLKFSNSGTRSLNNPTAEHLVNHRSSTWQ